jgi:RNA polymerase sigma factor (sigma-70 family)
MGGAPETCWTVVEEAAGGDREAREAFANHYVPVVRAYLRARWRASPLASEIDDAVQEVFVDCFKGDGALGRADRTRSGGFRAFLHGVVRIVALHFETRRARRKVRASGAFDPDRGEANEESLARVFDRAWAQQIMREAAERQANAADDDDRRRRVELLRLRFREGLPIRTIAQRWEADPAVVHRQYARARREFEAALSEVVAFHHPGTPSEVGERCRALLEHL